MSNYFDLDKAVAAWRRSLQYNRAFDAGDLDELERHVRDQVTALVRRGLSEEEAFHRALGEMGNYGVVEREYRKVYWGKRRRRRELLSELTWRTAMFKNYLKIAWRNLLRQKGYSLINVAGLTIGMACCLLIFQFVAFELSFDTHHAKADRLYRVLRGTTQNGEFLGEMVWTGYGEAPTYAEEVPGLARYTRVHYYFGQPVVSPVGAQDKTFKADRAYFVDPAFLSMFTVPFVAGDPASALTQPNSVLISESTARKYFERDEVVGEVLRVHGGYAEGDYEVVGVFEDVPPTSHLQYELLFPMQDLLATDRYKNPSSAWNNNNFYTYVEVSEGAQLADLEAQLTQSYTSHNRDALEAANRTAEMRLEPLRDIHLNGDIVAPFTVVGDRKTVYFFSIIALLTFLIALINYVNLSTARALDRAKEVGVRKVVGANRRQLVAQFLFESALMNLVALTLAIGLSFTLVPVVNQLADVQLSGATWTDARFWSAFVVAFGAGALLSGLYPAFVLSAFKPVVVLKGKVGAFASRFSLRKVLVVLQFAVSIALLAGTFVVYTQVNYMRSMDLGLQLDQVLVIEAPRVFGGGLSRDAALHTLKQELRKLSGVEEVAESMTVPGQGFSWTSSMYRINADPSTQQRVRGTNIDHNFAEVYGLELVAGRPFTVSTPTEGRPTPVLLNETGIRQLGFPSAEAALGHDIYVGDTDFRIYGVLKDFNWTSVHEERDAIFFYPVGPWDPGGTISARLSATDLQGTLADVQHLWETLFPGNPFEYFFADQEFDQLYRNDRRFAILFSIFAGLAIFIACLGLFGLAAFTAQQRTKEIGVRKVLGASVGSVIALLSTDFLKLVGVAFLVATPVAYVIMQRWLTDFAYRIDLSAWIFLLAGLLALGVALLTVSYQSIKAALADPVKSLRYE